MTFKDILDLLPNGEDEQSFDDITPTSIVLIHQGEKQGIINSNSKYAHAFDDMTVLSMRPVGMNMLEIDFDDETDNNGENNNESENNNSENENNENNNETETPTNTPTEPNDENQGEEEPTEPIEPNEDTEGDE